MSAQIFVGGLGGLRRKQPHSLTRNADRALYAKLATALFLRALRQVVDSTVGDVVQLVRTLPRRWLESRTVTADSFYPGLFACFLCLLAVHSHTLRYIRADLTAVTRRTDAGGHLQAAPGLNHTGRWA